MFSFGIGIPVSDRFDIEIDYTRYREIGLGLTLGSSVGMIDEGESNPATVGLRFRF